ncbi:MAG: DUF3027 domain-containing protein [Bradymonadaceae bacterium]
MTKQLTEDKNHFTRTTERWVQNLNRNLSTMNVPEHWWEDQCYCCLYYIRLCGAFIHDWGVCTNPASPFDGRVMFEHDGCDAFVYADEQWNLRDTIERLKSEGKV